MYPKMVSHSQSCLVSVVLGLQTCADALQDLPLCVSVFSFPTLCCRLIFVHIQSSPLLDPLQFCLRSFNLCTGMLTFPDLFFLLEAPFVPLGESASSFLFPWCSTVLTFVYAFDNFFLWMDFVISTMFPTPLQGLDFASCPNLSFPSFSSSHDDIEPCLSFLT